MAGKELVPTGTVTSDATAVVAASPRNVQHLGGAENPSVTALRETFGSAVLRSEVIWGETTVYIERARIHDVIQWLHDEPSQLYNYLVDVTAVEYRDSTTPLQVVWHLRSLPYRRFMRVKVELPKRSELTVPSITDIYTGADWLERETYDMFGIRFEGHPDLRRILLWESYREGYPLRKDFPLRGRFSRSEQLKQALAADPEARYSMEELTIADAFDALPADMQARLTERRSDADDPGTGE